MQELEFITTGCQLSRTYKMMGNILKLLSIDVFWIIPSIDWRNTLIKTFHDLGSFHLVINMKLAEL